jgi:hypothetical protein
VTSEAECIEALQQAKERLGESPTKAQYEQLGLTPSASTIARVCGSWNAGKRAADLDTNPSRGSRTWPKPEDVELPESMSWESLSADQRWHYRNRNVNAERTLQRRAELRAWVYRLRQSHGCSRCTEDNPACLEFHHVDEADKEMQIGRMVTHGYSRERIEEEIEKCIVLCANCHRKEHYEPPDPIEDA